MDVSDLELATATVGVVSTLRGQWKRLDGLGVSAATMLVAVLVVFAFATPAAALTLGALIELGRHGLRVGLMALGGTFLVGYGGRKLGETMRDSVRPPPLPTPSPAPAASGTVDSVPPTPRNT